MTDTVTSDTVDLIAFHGNQVLLIERGDEPFKGRGALPGGYIDPGETSRAAAVREAAEETDLTVDPARLHRVGVYDTPGRDPRGHVVSEAYAIVLDHPGLVRAGDDAAAAAWVDIDDALRRPLAFDHRQILDDAVALRRAGAIG
jgi:8-oxo-dGTP diphosphatase